MARPHSQVEECKNLDTEKGLLTRDLELVKKENEVEVKKREVSFRKELQDKQFEVDALERGKKELQNAIEKYSRSSRDPFQGEEIRIPCSKTEAEALIGWFDDL